MNYSLNKTRAKFLALLTLIVVLNFQSCKRYEEGPVVALKSPKKRLAKKWDLKEVNGKVPLEEIYAQLSENVEVVDYDITFDFDEDGDFTMKAVYTIKYEYSGNYGSYSDTETFPLRLDGEWEFSSDKEEIEIEFDYSYYGAYSPVFRGRDYKILRLANDELKLEAENGDEWTFED